MKPQTADMEMTHAQQAEFAARQREAAAEARVNNAVAAELAKLTAPEPNAQLPRS